MFTFEDIQSQIAVWEVNKGFYLSHENEKKLLSFYNVDEVINYLYLNGFKQTARKIHAKNKSIKLEV